MLGVKQKVKAFVEKCVKDYLTTITSKRTMLTEMDEMRLQQFEKNVDELSSQCRWAVDLYNKVVDERIELEKTWDSYKEYLANLDYQKTLDQVHALSQRLVVFEAMEWVRAVQGLDRMKFREVSDITERLTKLEDAMHILAGQNAKIVRATESHALRLTSWN